MPAAGQVRVVHDAVPGRVRLRIAKLYRSESLKQAIESALSSHESVIAISANPLTCGVLVLFRPGLDAAGIVAAIEAIVPGVKRLPAPRIPAPPITAPPKPRAGRKITVTPNALEPPPGAPDTQWHTLPVEAILDRVSADRSAGLAAAEVALRLSRYGPNALPRAATRSAWSILLGQFNSLPVMLLGASAVLSAATGGLADAAVILVVVLINAGIGFVTESRAETTINALTSLPRPPAQVIREGAAVQVPAEEIVPGDLLVLTPGMPVAADARLLESRLLTIDESALTGESHPVAKSPEVLPRSDLPLADRTNMAYMGTAVTGGSGLAVVVGSARDTELGRIHALVGAARPPETPMQRQLDRLGNQMVMLAGGICGVFFGVGLLRGIPFLEMLRSAISLAVAAVPEGLPAVATTTLALGIRDMARHKVLIRHLDAVETLGSVQVICLDKTGTLTANRMSVLELSTAAARLKVCEGRFVGPQGAVDPYQIDELLRILHVGVLCNETELDQREDSCRLNGSATENALVYLALAAGISVRDLRGHYRRLRTEYRSEGRQYMVTWHQAAPGRNLVAVKGSPEQVLRLCRWVIQDGERRKLTARTREAIMLENERMASAALRVLGFAYLEAESAGDPLASELTWLGLVGMADPLRRGTPELIGQFHQAGIKTIMITGDQSTTAYAIGRELGLSGDDRLEIMDSTHLERLDPELMSALAQKVSVFSRVSPANKLQIVQGLQQAGRVVAMTGDGINDGPALKAADIGVAMGSGGTDVARMVADVVLEDDELQTMIVAVSQGRTIYDNIRKSIHFLMSTNLSEIAVMLAATGAGGVPPLNTMQLLWINLITDVFPALALAMEPAEPDVLLRAPRDPGEPILRRQDFKRYGLESLAITAGTMAGYGYGLARYGAGPQANTIAFTGLTFAQLLHALSCRSEQHGIFSGTGLQPNRHLRAAIGASALIQAATVVVPGLRALLGTAPLAPFDAVVCVAAAGLPFLANEALKPWLAERASGAPLAAAHRSQEEK
jgi:Ca2+-transporting ATPase